MSLPGIEHFARLAAKTLDAPVGWISLPSEGRCFVHDHRVPCSDEPDTIAVVTAATGSSELTSLVACGDRVPCGLPIEPHGLVAYASVPVVLRGETCIGSIGAAFAQMPSWRRELAVLEEIALAAAHTLQLSQRVRRSDGLLARMAEIASRVEAEQRDFAARVRAVVHDLRTPLNVLLHGVEELLRDEPTDPTRPIIMRSMRRNVEHASAMLRSLQGPFHDIGDPPGNVDLVALTRDLCADLRPATEMPRLECDVPSGSTFVPGDATALRRCILNLVTNALRFAHRVVAVSVVGRHDGVTVAVEDDGPGLPDESDYARAWDDGVRLHPEHGSQTGLGLAIARGIARDLGGDVFASKSALGGACFGFVVPRLQH